jgi:hypothetical protein
MRALAILAPLAALEAPAFAEVPKLANISGERTRIVVRGELAKGKQKPLVALVEAVVADVERRFSGDARDADREVTLLLFSDQDRYREVAGTYSQPLVSDWGFYLPARRVAIANVGQSVGNLRHELVHPLLGDDYPGIPTWLNEGIAALYGTAKQTKQGFQFLVNYRLADLQRALKAGTLPSLATLAATTDADVRADPMVYYALSRYVLLFADREGTLDVLYAELRAADVREHGRILARHVDEAKFLAWAKKLRR